MKMRLLFVLACLSFAARLHGQTPYTGPLPVHQANLNTVNQEGTIFAYPNDRPDRQQYDDPSEWPKDSFQGHWGSPVVNSMFQPNHQFGVGDMPCHGHIEWQFPRYAEWHAGVTLTMNFSFVLFHCDGHIAIPYFGFFRDPTYLATVVWKETGTSTPPDMQGDPMGIKQWFGTVTMTPDLDGALVKHGWYDASIDFEVRFNNPQPLFDAMQVHATEPFYAMFDESVPEAPEGPLLRLETDPCSFINTPVTPDGSDKPCRFSGQFINGLQFLPTTAPMTRPLMFDLMTQGYGAVLPTPDEALLILDPDIHNGINGLREVDVVKPNQPDTNNIVPNVFLDPNLMCANPAPASYAPGIHKYALVRFQPDDVFESAGLIVLTLTADCAHLEPAPPPPPPIIVCVPPLVLKGNHCVSPVPSAPLWMTVGTMSGHDLQQLFNSDRTPAEPAEFRVCQTGDTNCSGPEIDN